MKKTIILALILTGFLVFLNPNFSKVQAITLEELQAQIQQLFQIIQQLLAQRLQQSQGRYCFYSNLSYGMRSPEVKNLQIVLGVTPATGYFGDTTLAAVKKFQEEHNIKVTGEVGPQTREVLNDLYCVSPVICVDSDGGNNPNIKGTVTIGSQTYTDICASGTTLKEHYCSNNQLQTSVITCPTGSICQNGVCIINQVFLPDLIISDLSANKTSGALNEKITISVSEKNIGAGTADIHHLIVIEENKDGVIPVLTSTSRPLASGDVFTTSGTFSCYYPGKHILTAKANYKIDAGIVSIKGIQETDETNNTKTITINCSAPPDYKCTDSDGGKNYYVKGSIIDALGFTYFDMCMANNVLLEHYCENNNATSEDYTCPNNYTCQDGACKQSANSTSYLDSLKTQLPQLSDLIKRLSAALIHSG